MTDGYNEDGWVVQRFFFVSYGLNRVGRSDGGKDVFVDADSILS